MTTHTLSVLVENKPGVLVRIAGLFSRRGFNIDSLAVGPTEHEEISRITIVVNCDEHPLEQVTKQLNKLINVLKIVELEPGATVQRELILIKVRADAESRSRVLETVNLFRAKVVDVALDVITVEATGNREKLEALLRRRERRPRRRWRGESRPTSFVREEVPDRSGGLTLPGDRRR